LRSQLTRAKEELKKLEQLNVDLHDELEKEKDSAATQLAGVQADAEDVIKELRRTVEDLRGQLKQQVGSHWGFFQRLLC
jgi:signal transduction histidine kinase